MEAEANHEGNPTTTRHKAPARRIGGCFCASLRTDHAARLDARRAGPAGAGAGVARGGRTAGRRRVPSGAGVAAMSGTWVVRTVRHGRVKIDGKWYAPNQHHAPYDGRLDGLRMNFGRYLQAGEWLPFVNLHSLDCDHDGGVMDDEGFWCDKCWPGPACVDGCDPWCFWDEVPA